MRKAQQRFFAGAVAVATDAAGEAEEPPAGQGVRGVAGRLRPYRDVRAGFEPWRRVALLAWVAHEESAAVH